MRGEEEQAFRAKGASWAQVLRWKGYPILRVEQGGLGRMGQDPDRPIWTLLATDFIPGAVGASRTWSKGVTFKLCVEKVLMSLENVNLRERRQSPQNIRPDLCAVSRLHYVKKPCKPRKTEIRFIWPTGGGGVVKWAVTTLGVQGLFLGG